MFYHFQFSIFHFQLSVPILDTMYAHFGHPSCILFHGLMGLMGPIGLMGVLDFSPVRFVRCVRHFGHHLPFPHSRETPVLHNVFGSTGKPGNTGKYGMVFPVPYFSLPHSRDPQAGHTLATSGYPHFGQLLCTMLFHIILILPIIPSAPPVLAVKQRNYGLYGQYNMYLMDCMTPCTFQL